MRVNRVMLVLKALVAASAETDLDNTPELTAAAVELGFITTDTGSPFLWLGAGLHHNIFPQKLITYF